jgi:uncharacterized membrane-anchored protein YjiN (DUF445 family)
MRSKLEKYDFVRDAILPLMGPLRAHLRELFRAIGREVLNGIDIKPLANLMAKGLVNAAEGERFAPFLADLAQRAREKGWLEPLVRELVRRLQQWADLPQCRRQIRLRLDHAAAAYRDRDTIKDIGFFVGKMVGAIDLDSAAEVIQGELRRFATDQLAPDSQVQSLLADGLAGIERRLREDQDYLASLRGMLRESRTLAALFEPVLLSLRDEASQQLQASHPPWLEIDAAQIDSWVKRLETDPALVEQVNAWCRRMAIQQVEQHHGLIGVLVEEQMNRLSEENLSALIQSRVGEDLNWIRLNGTFVGGLIGVGLYLLATLVRILSG